MLRCSINPRSLRTCFPFPYTVLWDDIQEERKSGVGALGSVHTEHYKRLGDYWKNEVGTGREAERPRETVIIIVTYSDCADTDEVGG